MEEATAVPAPAPAPLAVRFNGRGSEYFKIWIVNLALSLLTLGIYSAWAKVRRLQYFYRNTELDGSSFDYHGTPLAILKGRIVALVLFVLVNYAGRISPLLSIVGLVVLFALAPWLVRSSLRFRLYNSSYRGLRFGFTGSLGTIYAVFYGVPLAMAVGAALIAVLMALSKPLGVLLAILFGLALPFGLYPWWHWQFKRYQHGSARFGATAFSFEASFGEFAGVYAKGMLLLLAVMAVGAFALGGTLGSLAAMHPGQKPDPQMMKTVMPVLFAFYAALFLIVGPYFTSRVQNLIWKRTRLGPHGFDSRLQARRLLWLYLSNFVGVALTLGLYWPWAMVRLARYRAQSMSLVPAGSLEEFAAGELQAAGAVGEETMSVFDIDISL